MGYSRDSFYRFQELYEKGGELALQDLSRRKPNHKKSYRTRKRRWRSTFRLTVNKEHRMNWIIVAPATVRSVWVCHDFGNLSKKTESIRSVHGPKRFSRINRIAGAGIRKRKLEKQVEGEIETEHPGYLDVKTRITWAQSKA
ncbi:hypothetical protein LEP1GSC025_1152 [Leptospira interrogans str. 2002000621]|nr:hypothetical protein LEP1GSC025_1152 [Leptospira interrogans str. 2002000621]